VKVTNAERAGVALFLAYDWAGTEEEIIAFGDAWDALNLEAFRDHTKRTPQGVAYIDGPAPLISDRLDHDVDLPVDAARVLLKHYPGARTPSNLGPAKARLLRKLRSIVSTADKDKEPEGK